MKIDPPSADVRELLRSMPPRTRDLALAVRRTILSNLPAAIELPDAKARVIGYGYGTGYKDMVATIILSRSGVKLGLVQGASLPDPEAMLAGAGKVHRHVVVSNVEDAEKPAVAALLSAGLTAWGTRSKGRLA